MKFIEQWKVTKFCKRAAALTRANKRQKELREEILDELTSGRALPAGGPFLIELAPNGGKESIDWESLYTSLYTKACVKKYGPVEGELRALAHIEEIKKKAPAKAEVEIHGVKYVGGVKLLPKVNPDYRVVRSEAA